MADKKVNMKFFKFRYWLLDTIGTGHLAEEEKNTRFVNAFFQNQNIELGGETYKIKVLEHEGNLVFGQIGRLSQINLHIDKGPLIEEETADDSPYIYYFAIAETNVQIIYIESNSSNIVGSTVKAIETKLEQIAFPLVQPMHAKFNCIVSDADFWKVIKGFSLVKAIEFKLIRPNFLRSDEAINDVLNDLNKTMNNEELTLGYKNDDGLDVKDDDEAIKSQAHYASEYSGSWAVTGKRSLDTSSEKITKYKRFKLTRLAIPKRIIENFKDLFNVLKNHLKKD